MAECYYEPTPATDGATMNPVPGAVFQVFELSDTGFTSPLSLRVGAGNPTTTVAASESLATLPGVWVTSPNFEHIWVSGSFRWRRDSIDGAKAAIQDAKVAAVDAAASSGSSAQSSADSAQAAQAAAALVDAPADTVMAGVAGNPGSQFATQLSATFVARESLYVRDYLIEGATPAQNRTAIQQAIEDALDSGRDLCYDSMTTFGQSVQIDAPLTTSRPGIRHWSSNRRTAIVEQTVKPLGVFATTAANVTYEGITAQGPGLTLDFPGSEREKSYGFRIGPNSHYAKIINCAARGFHRGAMFRANEDFTADFPAVVNIHGARIENFEVEDVWCGVLGHGVSDLVVDRLEGSYERAIGSATNPADEPAHLIYLTVNRQADGASPRYWNYNVQVSNCVARSGDYGAPYSLKYIRGLVTNNLRATSCPGLFDFIWLQDFVVGSYAATEDTFAYSTNAGSITLQTCVDGIIQPGVIRFAAMDHGPAFHCFLDTARVEVQKPFVVARNTVDRGTTDAGTMFRVSGYDNVLTEPNVKNEGSKLGSAVILQPTGARATVRGLRTIGSIRAGIVSGGGMDGNVIEYDPAIISADQPVRIPTSPVPTKFPELVNKSKIRMPGEDKRIIGWTFGEQLLDNRTQWWPSGQLGTVRNGTWALDTDGFLRETSGTGLGLMTAGFSSPDIDISAAVSLRGTTPEPRAGFALRAIDNDTFLTPCISNSGVLLAANDGQDSATPGPTLASHAMTITKGRFYVLRSIIVENTVEVYIDGLRVITYTLVAPQTTVHAASVNHGLYARQGGLHLFGTVTARRVK